MSQESSNQEDKKAKLAAAYPVSRGYVATQNTINGLLNDLLGTVKGIRKQQKEQQEKIEQLTKQVNDQQAELERLRLYQNASGGAATATTPPSTSSKASHTTTNDLSQFRRDLVGIIGEALAQHEEEHHENNPAAPARSESAIHKNATETSSEDATLWQKEWEEFRSTILPRHLIRTFHSNGATMLQGPGQCSYIDYPMPMINSNPEKEQSEISTYSWSLQAQGKEWAVGIATFASLSKWDPTESKLLGDAKGEWAFRSDATLWSNAKQRQTLKNASNDNPSISLTLTIEFHANSRIILKGSIDQQPVVVWFDIPWKNFKKPTSFFAAVSCQNDSVVRFRGWTT